MVGKSTTKSSVWKGSGAPTAATTAPVPLPVRKKDTEPSTTTVTTAAAKRSRHRYEKLLQSLETEETMALLTEEQEGDGEATEPPTQLSQLNAPPSILASASMPELGKQPIAHTVAPQQVVPLSSFQIAGIGGAVAVHLPKETVSQKQPVKGRAILQQSRSGGLCDDGQALALSTEGLQGMSAGLALRKFPSMHEQKPTTTTVAMAGGRKSTNSNPMEAVEMNDDVPDAPLSGSPKKQLRVVIPAVPSPSKLVGIREQPCGAGDTSDSDTERQHCTVLTPPALQHTEVLLPTPSQSQTHSISIDTAAVEAHLTQLRSIPLNETQSKESSQRLLEQLRLKREMRSKIS